MNSWFREMLYRDCLPTEETFTLLMEAYGREGDIKSAHNILRKVWNIDIVAIQKGRPTSLSAATSQTSSSTLSPSVGLLHTLARVFGMNSDIPTAMKLVDFVARNYDLKYQKQSGRYYSNGPSSFPKVAPGKKWSCLQN